MKRAHNAIHMSKLKEYQRNKGEQRPVQIIIDVDGTKELEVESILDTKKHNRRIYSLVQSANEIQEYEHSMRTSNSKQGWM